MKKQTSLLDSISHASGSLSLGLKFDLASIRCYSSGIKKKKPHTSTGPSQIGASWDGGVCTGHADAISQMCPSAGADEGLLERGRLTGKKKLREASEFDYCQ